LNTIEPFIYDRVSAFRGSISAEHGIGFMKNKYLKYSKTEIEINMMRRLKKLMDANGILNPMKIIY
jgi:FAD/FMN-containing dehydrogenase